MCLFFCCLGLSFGSAHFSLSINYTYVVMDLTQTNTSDDNVEPCVANCRPGVFSLLLVSPRGRTSKVGCSSEIFEKNP